MLLSRLVTEKNQLYYGDNLDVLRRYIRDESVDLIYLDPPFNSRQDYNVLFAERDGTRSSSQIKAFEDTWEWNLESQRSYEEMVERGGRVADALRAFHTFLFNSDMMAYLAMMAPRLVELHRVLKPTGSIYLHCDPTASHYLKILMDAVFGPTNFLNEVIWKRTSAHSSAQRYGPVHDVLLFYGKTADPAWIGAFQEYDNSYVAQRFRTGDERPWKDSDLTGSGIRHGETGLPWRGFDVTAKSRHWMYPPAELDELDKKGMIYWPKKKDGWPRLKKYLDQAKGIPAQDVWFDIFPINSQAQERLGYPTQKPEALLERIIKASSSEGDVVLDPFCGCGTAISVAQRLKRRWIGIDVTHLAIGLIKKRLSDAFGEQIKGTYEVIGEPTDVAGAAQLAKDNPFQFQAWALSLVNARPTGSGEAKRGPDRGIDGRLYFHDDKSGQSKQIVLSVKSGHVSSPFIRDLRGVIEREKAEIGALITMEEPTRDMKREAAEAGFYKSAALGKDYPRLQILTIEQLLSGHELQFPRLLEVTHKQAPKARGEKAKSMALPLGGEEEPF